MNFKKVAKMLLSCVMAGALFAGCGGEQVADKPSKNFSGDAVRLGMITPLNSTEKIMEDILVKFEEKADIKASEKVPHSVPKFFDSLQLMQMGIESGNIDAISLYNSVAAYVVTTNDKFELVPNPALNKISYSFCFAVRKNDAQLKTDLDKIVDDMKADGSLDKLINDYIIGVDANNIPKVEIPKIDGAETLKVGITGDLPPLDLILPDNSPAGFNTAMLAEVSKRLNKNIEIVQIESGSRATALNSKLIDVVFWAIVPFGNDDIPANIDKPEGVEFSAPYFKDNVAQIKLKK